MLRYNPPMIRAYLLFNAALYVLFSAWCTLAPDKTAAGIGLGLRSGSGRSEYITVYGGLQLGLAIFFGIAGLRAEYRTAGLIFALCLYGALVAFRLVTIITVPGLERMTYITGGLEMVLGATAAVLWWKRA